MKNYSISILLAVLLIIVSVLYISELNHQDYLGYKADTYWGGQKNAHLLLNRIINDQSHIVWGSGNHTASLVPLGAIGPSKYTSQLKGIIDNTQIAKVLKSAVRDDINVILVIGDGMGPNHMSIPIYENIARQNDETTYIQKIMNEGESSFVTNNPFGEIVGSSATTGTSIACGVKTRVGMLGIDPEGNPLESILDVAEKQGKTTGIVTDASVIDATPAAFFGHAVNRYDIAEITRQLIEDHSIEVIFGGGGAAFIPQGKKLSEMKGFESIQSNQDGISKRKDSINYLNTFSEKGYEIINSREGLFRLDKDAGKVVGLFNADNVGAVIDRANDSAEPSLFDYSEKALEILAGSGTGYFLMIEAARIDFESHDNDAGTVVKTMKEFDAILKFSYEHYNNNPDKTLLVFTADHETGGFSFSYFPVPNEERVPILLPNGQEYIRTKSSMLFKEYLKLFEQDKSVFQIFENAQNSENLFELLNKHLPYSITREESEMLFPLLKEYKKSK